MKRFRFRLEKVLDYKETEKEERERLLALKNRELQDREERLQGIISAQDAAVRGEETVTMAEMTLLGQYQEYLRNALVNQRLLVIEAVNAVEAARDAYIEKSVEVEMYQELKQRKLDQHKDEARREEKKELNELVVQRHRMGKGGGHGK